MARFPKGALIVGQPRMRGGECVVSLRIDKQHKEWRQWAWGIVRAEIAKYRVPFGRWSQVGWLIARFMWSVTH